MASRPIKRKKQTAGSASGSFDEHFFRSLGCKNRSQSIPGDRKFVKERALMLEEGEFPDIQENIRARGWESLVSYPEHASRQLAVEFFANAYQPPEEDRPANMSLYTSYVRGKFVPFDANTINEIFGLPNIPNCGYAARLPRNPRTDNANRTEIRNALCRPGEGWKWNQDETPSKMMITALTPSARAWADFVLHTLLPCSNTSELNFQRADLVASIILREPINVGKLLATELSAMANADMKQRWLQHASLVAKLCARVEVVASEEEIQVKKKQAITGGWIRAISFPNQGEPHQQAPTAEAHPEEHFDAFATNPQPTRGDFQMLEARMDTLALEHREGMERLAQEHREGMERLTQEHQRGMESLAERLTQEHRSGIQALYRAMHAFHRGEQLDPEADIYPVQFSGPGPSGHQP